MAILATFTQQPAETLDYDVDFTDFLLGASDTAASFTVTPESGITVVSSSLASGAVKVWITGGVSGSRYKITIRLTTTGGRVKEDEIVIRVKEI